jgi:hypothetical protein
VAADARRRRSGGACHRRLQRRDDRPHRRLSLGARPRDLRRRAGGHRARHVRPWAARICEWTQEHYAFSGYVTLFDPGELPDRAALGYGGDERVCLVSARASANTCSTASARPPGGARARPGAADDRRHRAADRRGPSRPTAPHGRRR